MQVSQHSGAHRWCVCECASVRLVFIVLCVKQRGKPWLTLDFQPIRWATTVPSLSLSAYNNACLCQSDLNSTQQKWQVQEEMGSKDEADGRRAKCSLLSAGFPRSFSTVSSIIHTLQTHSYAESVRDSASDGWPNESGRCEFGSRSKRVASSEDLVKQISVFSPRLSLSLWHTYSAED